MVTAKVHHHLPVVVVSGLKNARCAWPKSGHSPLTVELPAYGYQLYTLQPVAKLP